MAKWLPFISVLFLLHLQVYAPQAFDPLTKFSKLNLPPGVTGPDSAFLDRHEQGPYVGVGDGRILKYNGTYFEDFAYISPERTKAECDGVTAVSQRRKCGRPLGFAYHSETEKLYIVGAFGGLYVVGPHGGLATLLVTQANGVTLNYLNGIDVDAPRNLLYITDQSLIYTFQDFVDGKPYPVGDSTGRLIEYNIGTGQVRVLLQSLPRPVGPAVSAAGTFVVYSSRSDRRVYKYSISTGTANVLLSDLPGSPWKIKRAPNLLPLLPETFWVAVNVQQPDGSFIPFGYKFDSLGNIQVKKNFSAQFPANVQAVVIREYDQGLLQAKLYVGSLTTFLGVYST